MVIEHIGYQHPDPRAATPWYLQQLGFRLVRQLDQPPYTSFLVDSAGHGIVEFYCNPAAPLPDYPRQDPLVLHLALQVDDVPGERDRLLAAGATLADDVATTPYGDQIVMLRDPWGFPLQLVHRATPLV
ncbi:MAG: VOC family protein [Fimbriimonadaceae bacterium]|nr:VOC family protein [Fimbriimonadaceae bacterium]